jgi:uncharacterized protein (TIGR01244 family)
MLALLLLITAAQAPAPTAPPIRNLHQVSSEFCTAGQPTVEQLAALKQAGFKGVLNLRDPSEHDEPAERAAAAAAGLRYVHIPVPFMEPRDAQADAFLKATDEAANRPMLIHCTVGIRAAAFWMIRRVLREGWTVADAEAEARRIGLARSPHLVEFATAYIGKHRKPPPSH